MPMGTVWKRYSDALIKSDIKRFAVATIEEALKIKKIDANVNVLILGPCKMRICI